MLKRTVIGHWESFKEWVTGCEFRVAGRAVSGTEGERGRKKEKEGKEKEGARQIKC
jgi:hypothetical protein